MKIGFDAKRFFLNNTGLGNYSRWLVKGLAEHYPDHEYLLYTPKVKLNSRLNFLDRFNNIKTIAPVGKLITAWWRSKGIVHDLLRDKVDVYHGLSHELPIGIHESGIRSVVTVHDLIFMRYPQYFGWISRNIYRLKVQKACSVANKVVAVSQKTKDDIIELLNIDPNKIEVIYQGCDPIFTAPQSDEVKQAVIKKYKLPAKFVLNVGTIEERKNLLLLAKAMQGIDVPLVVVGRPTKYLDEVKQYLSANNLSDRATFLHNVEFADLPAIYQLALVFVYPSRYEGFGIPILEALNCGTPVVAATGSCLEEAGGPDSLYVHPDDDRGLGIQINRVLNDNELAQQMITQGLKYASDFEDKKLAKQLMNLYNTIYHA